MEKLAVGPRGRGAIDLRKSPTENLKNVAKAMGRAVAELTVVILDRDRHKDLIAEVRKAGARVRLIEDGDVAGGVATCFEESGVDVLMGTGGAPEGVITAAAMRCVGGDMQGRLKPRSDEELARGEVMFAATGVTTGDFLKGVRFYAKGCETHSIVMRSKSGTVRYITATHQLDKKPGFGG